MGFCTTFASKGLFIYIYISFLDFQLLFQNCMLYFQKDNSLACIKNLFRSIQEPQVKEKHQTEDIQISLLMLAWRIVAFTVCVNQKCGRLYLNVYTIQLALNI